MSTALTPGHRDTSGQTDICTVVFLGVWMEPGPDSGCTGTPNIAPAATQCCSLQCTCSWGSAPSRDRKRAPQHLRSRGFPGLGPPYVCPEHGPSVSITLGTPRCAGCGGGLQRSTRGRCLASAAEALQEREGKLHFLLCSEMPLGPVRLFSRRTGSL